ncbi:MlaD family protein [Nocardia sp. NPDC056064]|uniref:MlaD family protein n=1 Tax=Nocardia sp. NPDC056064 TaxID=3345701 RepID=UPI0035D6B9F3
MRTRTMFVALALTAALSATGCGSPITAISGQKVPGPTYRIRAVFSNVLNLPLRGEVRANGALAGTVAGIAPMDPLRSGGRGYVVVDIDLATSVRLPTTTTAALRRDTVLSDNHIVLFTPRDGFSDLMAPGDTIGLERTTPPLEMESVMAALAVAFQGGAVAQVRDIVATVNSLLPQDPATTARLSGAMSRALVDLAGHLDQVDALLAGLSTDTEILRALIPDLEALLGPAAVQRFTDISASLVGAAGLLGALGPVGEAYWWLGPLLDSADGAVRVLAPLIWAGQPLDLSRPANLRALQELFREKLIPFAEHGPAVTITGIGVPAGAPTDPVLAALRMIGAVR